VSAFRLSCCIFLAASLLAGQDKTIRVDVNLIQLDVIVLDKSGGRVKGLALDDFEVYQNGKRQRIASVNYIHQENASLQKQGTHKVAVFLDDSRLSFESTGAIRRALVDFANQHVQPGDQIALFRASEDLGLMRTFTSDKQELEKAASDISFSGWSTVQSGTLQASLQALEGIVRALGDLPGRKSLIFISDQIQLNENSPNSVLFLNRVSDIATRAGVSISTIDPRGLVYHGLEASEKWNGSLQELCQLNLKRQGSFVEGRDGMMRLAKETGGLFYGDRNDLGRALADAIQDQDEYYLLAIQPDPGTFKPDRKAPRFHRLDVRLKPKGYTARHRRGFFGVAGLESENTEAALVRTLMSPFRAMGLSLNMKSLMGDRWKLVFDLDPKQFQFQDQPQNWKEAHIDQRVIVLDSNGVKVENLLKHHRIRLRREGFDKAMQDGLKLEINLNAPKPGTYQVRSAVEDLGNRLRGSTMAYVVKATKE
jgi:VWFA-related protein